MSTTYRKVVIIGAPRSGTNMLRDALCRLPQVATWPCDEINYVWRYGNVDAPTDELGVEDIPERARRYIRNRFDWVAHRYGARVVVEKTCANSLRVPYVDAIVPDAKYVFIHRNGWDVVSSAAKRWRAPMEFRYLLKKARFVPLADLAKYAVRYISARLYKGLSGQGRVASWGPKFRGMDAALAGSSLAEICALQWARCIELAVEALSKLPPGRVCAVAYEDLVASPRAELGRIASFLGCDVSEENLRYAIENISSERTGKGMQTMAAADRDAISGIVEESQAKIARFVRWRLPMHAPKDFSAQDLIDFVRSVHGDVPVPLHRPVFSASDRAAVADCVESNFVSSVGARVGEFEERIARYTGARFAIATVNGTAALHMALMLAGVRAGDEVVGQALTFIATCNALSYVGAHPVFVDVDRDTLGMSPDALRSFLAANVEMRDGSAWNRSTGRRIAACVPMHTFGFPVRIEAIAEVCEEFSIPLVEDAAESLGSWVGARHTGTFGRLATLSFNGNKIITTGGGGMIVTDNEDLARRAKHLTTTAKLPHPYEFVHDEVGYNYRLPNLNAALGCTQMEKLEAMVEIKRDLARGYRDFFADTGVRVVDGLPGTTPNYWLNAIVLDSASERDEFLEFTNRQGVMTRPIWRLMSRLPMYERCQNDGLENSRWLEERVVNLPSSVPESQFGRLPG